MAEKQRFSRAAQRWTLIAAILGSGMAFIDGSVVNVALPALQRHLGASASQVQWVVEAYALLLSALLLVGGSAGDRYGRRKVFMLGTAVFTAASLACALSPSVQWLIGARAVQGLGAALVVPGSLALLTAVYDEHERGAAIGTWSAVSGIAAAAGPVLGGWLIEVLSWHWAFLVNLPFGAALLAVCAWKVPESRDEHADAPLDLPGIVLATVGLAGVVFALIEAPERGWGAAAVWGAGAGGLLALAAFVAVEQHCRPPRRPLLPLALFRDLNFSGANLLTLLLYAALGGGLYWLPLLLIQVRGYSAAAAGAALLPFILLLFALSRPMGQVVDRIGPRLPLIVGPLVAAAGFALFAWPFGDGGYWTTWFPAVSVLGLGMAITVAPLTTTVMNAADASQTGLASGVNNAVSRVAGLIAVAAFGVVMGHAFDPLLKDALAQAKLPAQAAEAVWSQRHMLGALQPPQGLDAGAAQAVKQAVAHAFRAGFRDVMAWCALLAVLGAASAAVFIRRPRRA
jgi:EmrB/QacA subfamily drug resistance transporter